MRSIGQTGSVRFVFVRFRVSNDFSSFRVRRGGCKQGRLREIIRGTTPPEVLPGYVEEFRENGINLDFAEVA